MINLTPFEIINEYKKEKEIYSKNTDSLYNSQFQNFTFYKIKRNNGEQAYITDINGEMDKNIFILGDSYVFYCKKNTQLGINAIQINDGEVSYRDSDMNIQFDYELNEQSFTFDITSDYEQYVITQNNVDWLIISQVTNIIDDGNTALCTLMLEPLDKKQLKVEFLSANQSVQSEVDIIELETNLPLTNYEIHDKTKSVKTKLEFEDQSSPIPVPIQITNLTESEYNLYSKYLDSNRTLPFFNNDYKKSLTIKQNSYVGTDGYHKFIIDYLDGNYMMANLFEYVWIICHFKLSAYNNVPKFDGKDNIGLTSRLQAIFENLSDSEFGDWIDKNVIEFAKSKIYSQDQVISGFGSISSGNSVQWDLFSKTQVPTSSPSLPTGWNSLRPTSEQWERFNGLIASLSQSLFSSRCDNYNDVSGALTHTHLLYLNDLRGVVYADKMTDMPSFNSTLFFVKLDSHIVRLEGKLINNKEVPIYRSNYFINDADWNYEKGVFPTKNDLNKAHLLFEAEYISRNEKPYHTYNVSLFLLKSAEVFSGSTTLSNTTYKSNIQSWLSGQPRFNKEFKDGVIPEIIGTPINDTSQRVNSYSKASEKIDNRDVVYNPIRFYQSSNVWFDGLIVSWDKYYKLDYDHNLTWSEFYNHEYITADHTYVYKQKYTADLTKITTDVRLVYNNVKKDGRTVIRSNIFKLPFKGELIEIYSSLSQEQKIQFQNSFKYSLVSTEFIANNKIKQCGMILRHVTCSAKYIQNGTTVDLTFTSKLDCYNDGFNKIYNQSNANLWNPNDTLLEQTTVPAFNAIANISEDPSKDTMYWMSHRDDLNEIYKLDSKQLPKFRFSYLNLPYRKYIFKLDKKTAITKLKFNFLNDGIFRVTVNGITYEVDNRTNKKVINKKLSTWIQI